MSSYDHIFKVLLKQVRDEKVECLSPCKVFLPNWNMKFLNVIFLSCFNFTQTLALT